MSAPRPAATVVLLRPGLNGLEALLTHRPTTMAFAPDVQVFPGGRVDAADADPGLQARSVVSAVDAATALGGDLPPEEALAAMVAAIREAFEEVGVLLAEPSRGQRWPTQELLAARRRLIDEPGSFPAIAETLDLRLRTDLLVPLSRWVTPPTLERRFDAQFFAAAFADESEITLLGDEVVAHAWHRPIDALDAMAAGDLAMWLPTSMTLEQLAYVGSVGEIRERLAPRRMGAIATEEIDHDIVRIEMPAGGGVAGQPVYAYLVGHRRCVLIDPGDPTGEGLDRAVEAAASRGGAIVAIALTHAAPDHAGGAEALRERLGVDILAGSGGWRHLPHPVTKLGDGSRVTASDVDLQVLATPGPAPEHLAFLIGEGQFAVTGDIDGRRGARSVPGPADDAAWQRSVARLRSVAPDATWLGGHPPLDSVS